MKKKYKYAAIILVYRNDKDLEECIKSFYEHIEDCKIVIVNAFYDEESKNKIKDIANVYNCDFINEINKGYSYGNNKGIKECKLANYFVYRGFKSNINLFFMIGIGLEKLKNKFYSILYKNKNNIKIFAAHGSFVVISRNVTEFIDPLYDENIFLFAEEGVLAYKAQNKGIYTNYNDNIVVHHKEDGSMKLADFSINNELKKANIYFYENYVRNNSKRG